MENRTGVKNAGSSTPLGNSTDSSIDLPTISILLNHTAQQGDSETLFDFPAEKI